MLGLLIIDHGSRRAASNQQLVEVAARVRRLRPQDRVAHAHMELAPPTIAEAVADLAGQGCDRIQVLPYFLSDGRHLGEDIPNLVADACASHAGLAWAIGAALGGSDDELPRLLLRRAGLGPQDRVPDAP